MRKLASIQRIKSVEPHSNADSLDIITVLGWKCVSQKGIFQSGDMCVFIEPDAQLSPVGPLQFLAGKNVRSSTDGRRDPVLQTVKLRGQVSQGLAIPVDEFELWENYAIYPLEGMDVTALLGITKYEAPVPLESADIRCHFPSLVPKTDEDRIQLFPDILDNYKSTLFFATLKYDGMSMTVFNDDGDFHVCSRNWSLKPGGTMWRLAEKYGLFDKLNPGDYLQAECYGESIQGNPHRIKGQDLAVFNIGYTEGFGQESPWGLKIICDEWDLPVVKEVAQFYGGEHNIDSLMALADSTGLEGIVVRPEDNTYDPTIGGSLSFKCISPHFLLRQK